MMNVKKVSFSISLLLVFYFYASEIKKQTPPLVKKSDLLSIFSDTKFGFCGYSTNKQKKVFTLAFKDLEPVVQTFTPGIPFPSVKTSSGYSNWEDIDVRGDDNIVITKNYQEPGSTNVFYVNTFKSELMGNIDCLGTYHCPTGGFNLILKKNFKKELFVQFPGNWIHEFIEYSKIFLPQKNKGTYHKKLYGTLVPFIKYEKDQDGKKEYYLFNCDTGTSIKLVNTDGGFVDNSDPQEEARYCYVNIVVNKNEDGQIVTQNNINVLHHDLKSSFWQIFTVDNGKCEHKYAYVFGANPYVILPLSEEEPLALFDAKIGKFLKIKGLDRLNELFVKYDFLNARVNNEVKPHIISGTQKLLIFIKALTDKNNYGALINLKDNIIEYIFKKSAQLEFPEDIETQTIESSRFSKRLISYINHQGLDVVRIVDLDKTNGDQYIKNAILTKALLKNGTNKNSIGSLFYTIVDKEKKSSIMTLQLPEMLSVNNNIAKTIPNCVDFTVFSSGNYIFGVKRDDNEKQWSDKIYIYDNSNGKFCGIFGWCLKGHLFLRDSNGDIRYIVVPKTIITPIASIWGESN